MDGFELRIVINRSNEEGFAVLSNRENPVDWRRESVDARKTSEGRHTALKGKFDTGCLKSPPQRAFHPHTDAAKYEELIAGIFFI